LTVVNWFKKLTLRESNSSQLVALSQLEKSIYMWTCWVLIGNEAWRIEC